MVGRGRVEAVAEELAESLAGLERDLAIRDGGEVVRGERDSEVEGMGGCRHVGDHAHVLRASG
jgi:hypothetical protein